MSFHDLTDPNPGDAKLREAIARERPFRELLDGVDEADLFLHRAETGIQLQIDALHLLCSEMPPEADGKLTFLVSSVQREVQGARARLYALADEIDALKRELAPRRRDPAAHADQPRATRQ